MIDRLHAHAIAMSAGREIEFGRQIDPDGEFLHLAGHAVGHIFVEQRHLSPIGQRPVAVGLDRAPNVPVVDAERIPDRRGLCASSVSDF